MKVVVTIAALDPARGGPTRTVPALCRALARLGLDVELITLAEHGRPVEAAGGNGFTITAVPTVADRYHPRSWCSAFTNSLTRALMDGKDAVLYDVGLWLPSNHFVAQIASRTQAPLIISPRGMLSKRALAVSRWKKRIAWNLYQRRDLNRACVLHATSKSEANDFRARGLSQPIAVVPNGVDLPADLSQPAKDSKPVRTLLFLSRLHPIKGLKDLVSAWARVRPDGWRVVVAGPNENHHQQDVESLAESLGVRSDFEFVGSVDDQEKWNLLGDADLFILPSHSENFGVVVAEALAAGLPVITTRATPWAELESHRCGWWVAAGVEGIAGALSSATTLDRGERRQMGERGRELVRRNYSWESASKTFLSVFEWLLHRHTRPSCVI